MVELSIQMPKKELKQQVIKALQSANGYPLKIRTIAHRALNKRHFGKHKDLKRITTVVSGILRTYPDIFERIPQSKRIGRWRLKEYG